MNKFLIGAGAAILVAVPALALQQGASAPRPDRDAPVTRGEVAARVQQRFAALDANHDGVVTRAEIDARREAGRSERRERMFAMLDADKNGQISRQEFSARPAGAGAGGMRGAGMHRGAKIGMGGPGGRWLERADANKDGKLTPAEASAPALARFDSVDTDKDGTVTPAERQAARGMLRRAWNAVRG